MRLIITDNLLMAASQLTEVHVENDLKWLM